MPPTYWLEGVRRSLLGRRDDGSPLSEWSHGELALALLASTLVLMALAQFVFRWGERRAQRLGRFDQTTGY
jgi:hypothetical protein